MNCLDCAETGGANLPAIGVCVGCGVAVCRDHAVIRRRHLTRTRPLILEEPVEPAARVLRCLICDAAQRALTGTGR